MMMMMMQARTQGGGGFKPPPPFFFLFFFLLVTPEVGLVDGPASLGLARLSRLAKTTLFINSCVRYSVMMDVTVWALETFNVPAIYTHYIVLSDISPIGSSPCIPYTPGGGGGSLPTEVVPDARESPSKKHPINEDLMVIPKDTLNKSHGPISTSLIRTIVTFTYQNRPY